MWLTLRRGNCNFDRALKDKWGSTETATGVCDCSYGHTTRMGMGVLQVRIQAYIKVNFLWDYRIFDILYLLLAHSLTGTDF